MDKNDREYKDNKELVSVSGEKGSVEDNKENIRFDDVVLERVSSISGRGERRGLLLGIGLLSILIVIFLAVIFAICLGTDNNEKEVFVDTPVADEKNQLGSVYINDMESDSLSVSEIYEKCKESVVSVSAKKGTVSGIGSGFVYSADGYVATANHVVEGMEEIYVIFSDGSRVRAEKIAGDSFTDIALLRVERTGLKVVEHGDSEKLLVGERVVAIGTPASLDYAGSVSSGEVSYLDRIVKIYDEDGKTLKKKMKLIQTTAPLNPGNSGCPLFDARGRVVGMVTMKLGSDFDGMGFAIPSNGTFEILSVMRSGGVLTDRLLSAVSVRGARLGVIGEAVNDGKIVGVKISGFSLNDCDAAIKLKVGDIIISFEGEAVDGVEDIEKLAEEYSSGDVITVTVLRGGQKLSFEVTLTS